MGDNGLLHPRFCEKKCGYIGLPTSGLSVTVKDMTLIFLHVKLNMWSFNVFKTPGNQYTYNGGLGKPVNSIEFLYRRLKHK